MTSDELKRARFLARYGSASHGPDPATENDLTWEGHQILAASMHNPQTTLDQIKHAKNDTHLNVADIAHDLRVQRMAATK